MSILDLNSQGLKRRLEKVDYVFDDKNPNFHPNNEYNLYYLNSMQKLFNDKLQVRGYVFLNEVLVELGLAPRMIGQLAGWRRDAPGIGYIHIDVTQTRCLGTEVKEYFLRIKHDGLIFDVLGD